KLSVPETFQNLQSGDVDVFLGNWMPAQSKNLLLCLDNKTVQQVALNLSNARYTLAVPKYVYEAGVTSAEHLTTKAALFQRKIYGIEAGDDGNRIILDMIEKNTYQLNGWTLIESSEKEMLVTVKRAIEEKQWIVFLGWQPHPMNTKMEMAYLDDPVGIWGPGGGISEVHTLLSTKFVNRSPQLIPFFKNLTFTLEMENEWMKQILEDGKDPEIMAKTWLQEHPKEKEFWIKHLNKLENSTTPTEKKDQ
ncbi:MAG: glycine betaine ABC transporter substrate-binding protein, partial [Planctomycetota bacterium]